jgi:BlaI family penicillinase repressor
MKQMTDSEKIVMQIIWNANDKVSTSHILSHLPDDIKWKPTTVNTFLTRLSERGMIVIASRDGRSNLYEAAISAEEYFISIAREFTKDGGVLSIKNLIASLYSTKDINKTNLNELRAWLSKETYDTDHH